MGLSLLRLTLVRLTLLPGVGAQLLRLAVVTVLLLPIVVAWCEQAVWAAGAVQQSPEAFCAQYGQVFDVAQYACVPSATKPATEAMGTLLGESGEVAQAPPAGGPLVGLSGTVIDAGTIEASVTGTAVQSGNADTQTGGGTSTSSGTAGDASGNPACHNGIALDGCEDGTATLCAFIPHRGMAPSPLAHMCTTAALLFGLGVIRRTF